MSATLCFTDKDSKFVAPWECHCVCLPDPDYPMFKEDCGCPKRDCNMSNSNARAVLSALGLPTSFEEETMLPQELYAACERYLTSEIAEVIDHGTDSYEDSAPGSCTMIMCGRRPGYLTDRVTQIKKLCAEAMLAGAIRCYFC